MEYLLSTEQDLPDLHLAEKLKLWLADNPKSIDGRIALARHLVWEEPSEIESLLSMIKMDDTFYHQASAIQAIAEFRLLEFDPQHPARQQTCRSHNP